MKHAIRFFILAAAFVALAPVDAEAATCDLTEYPPTGTLTANDLNARLRQTEFCVNGRLGAVNFNFAEPLPITNLQNKNAVYAVSFTIQDEDGDAIAGEDIAATLNIKKFRVPVASTFIGASMGMRCPSDVTGTPGDCAAAAVTLVVQRSSTTVTTFAAIATDVVQLNTGLNASVATTDIMNIDVSGTFTDVDFIDVVLYFKAQHQT